MPKSFSPPPPAYDLHPFNKTASTIQLTTNEIGQSKEKLREKNATRDGPLSTSDFGSVMHIVKGSCGSGFLAMPDAFHNIGLLLGCICTVIVSIVCAHCTHILGPRCHHPHHQEQLWLRLPRYARRLQEHRTAAGYHRDFGAFLHVMKSSLGSGFLAMPYAFHNIGLLFGVMGTTLVAIVSTHCTHVVVKCSQELCYQQGKTAMTYTETVETAFKFGARGRFNRFSKIMMCVSNFFLFITYYGVNTVYVILIASSFKQVLENHIDFTMNIRWYALIMLLLLLPIGIVRHIKFLVPFSAMANLFLLIGCSLTLYFCFIDIPPIFSRPMVVDVARWPLFFSTALFGMEGIGTVMPIENAMRHPSHFLGCPGVLNLGMTVVASVFLVMGAVGYVKYGDAVQGSITLNLPQDALSEAVKVLVALAILFTYPLQLTASVEVVWTRASTWFSEKEQDKGYYIVRALMIVGTVVIAIAVPNLSPVLSLVGAIGFSGLGLLLPTLTELVTYWDVIAKPCGLTMIKNVVIILIWAFATIFGTITSIHEIVVEYNISK